MGGHGVADGETIQVFDNFAITPFMMDGKEWLSSEQAYQAAKFKGTDWAEEIRKTTNMNCVYLMGQSREHKMQVPFNRREVMKRCIRYKLMYNSDVSIKLISTEGPIEFPGSDAYWGTNNGKGGENVLGKIYAELREEIIS